MNTPLEINKSKTAPIQIFLQTGTCSIVAGITKTRDAFIQYIESHQIDADLIETGCMGMCSNDPVVDILIPGRNKISFRRVMPSDVAIICDCIFNNILPEKTHILGQYKSNDRFPWEFVPYIDELPFFATQKRILLSGIETIRPDSASDYESLGGFTALLKAIRTMTPAAVCSEIAESGLTGRGGGGYSTGSKLRTVLQQHSYKKYLICNADESDPGSFSGRLLVEAKPFLLLEGIIIAAYASGANQAIIYIRNKYRLSIDRLQRCIHQLYELKWLGDDILDSGINLRISIYESPGAFVCGEETALIENLEGNRGMPRTKPPYPAISGLHGMPTVVNNVETLCNIPAIISNGAAWFRSIGNNNTTGTKLFSVSGKTEIGGVVEIEMGSTIRQVIDACGGPQSHSEMKAVHLGGPSGGLVPVEDFGIPLDYYHLDKQKLYLGSGSFAVLDQENCIVNTCRYFMEFIEGESCGKCIPCREGSQRITEIFKRISNKPNDAEEFATLLRFKGVMQLEQMAEVMHETSLCGLGQHAPNVVTTALKHFREEFEEHIFERKCRAGVCKNLKSYSIDHTACTGCGMCAKRCPADAIAGSLRQTHYIISERCIGCGMCMESCKFNAVILK